MGLRTVTSTSTGLAFAAIEYLAAAGLLVYVAGSLAWVAIVVAGGLALMAWAFFGELCGLFPTAAAIRLYMSRAMDDRIALSVTFAYMSTIVLVLAADAYIVGEALTHVTGLPSYATGVIIALLLGIATVSNLRGLQVAGRVQDIATYAVIAATLVLGVVAVAHSKNAASRAADATRAHHGAGSFITAVALGVLLYSAFEWVTTSAEEVRDFRLIPRGMLITLGILGTVCALISVGMGNLLSHAELNSAYPQLFLGRAAMGQFGYYLMLVVTLVTAINTFNGGFITASRFIYATAREGSLPPLFARLNSQAVPWVPVLVLAGASLVAALAVSVSGQFQLLLSTGAALESAIYAVAGFCVWKLRRRLPEQHRPFRMRYAGAIAWIGIVVFGVLALVSSVQVKDKTNPAPLVLILVIFAAACYYVVVWLPKVRAAAEAKKAAAGPRRRRPVVTADPASPSPEFSDSAAEGGHALRDR
jgi:amino acid transporter